MENGEGKEEKGEREGGMKMEEGVEGKGEGKGECRMQKGRKKMEGEGVSGSAAKGEEGEGVEKRKGT